MGADGHTASLFPGTKLVKDIVAKQIPPHQFVAATWVEKLNADRITLLPNVINQAHRIVFLIAGEDKAKAMKEVFDGEYDPEVYPSQLVRPADKVMCVLV